MSADSAKQPVDVGNDDPKPPHNELLQQLGLDLTSSDDDDENQRVKAGKELFYVL